jgi:predicted Zn-dependent peptidase
MKQNAEDKLFDLQMRYEFGNEADIRYSYAANYLDLLGTNKISAEQIKQQFYKLACNFGINVSEKNITVSLNGLAENMPQAIALAENVLKNAKTDKTAWKNFVAMVLKNREDTKKEQKSNFNAVKAYGIYGTYNNVLNDLSTEQLQNTNPADMVALIKKLSTYKHTVLYYGPATEKQLNTLISKEHKIATKLADVPVNKPYMEQQTPKNEILLAPYDAKNIYMTMYHNEGKMFNPAEAPVAAVFNEYFGGGMNTVVFQELREARGLAYSARAYYYNMPIKNHPQYGTTYIISQNDKMMDCIRVFKEILDTIPQNEANFNLAKQSLQKQLASMRVTKMNIINSYINAKERGLDYDINRSIYNALPSITLNDIVNYEKQNMANKPYRYIILGDEKNLNMNALEKIAPIKRISTKDIFGY